MDQPRRFRVQDENGVTRIEWRWFGARRVLAVVWLPMVFGMWWFWYTDMTSQGPPSTSEVCFLAVTALLPIACLYLCLAKICNRSRLVIDADSIELRQGPFPWPGNGRWSRSALSGFISATSSGSYRGATFRWYAVYALWRGSLKRRIAGDLGNEDEAIWLATTLDQRFGYDRDLEKTAPPAGEEQIRLR